MMKKRLLFTFFLCLLITPEAFADCQWVQRASFGGAARHRCTGFSVGNKGYIGGGHINSAIEITHADYWQYDPSNDSWTQIADFAGGKRYHSVAFSIDEFGYVGCGEDDADAYHNDFYRYVPQYNVWQPIADFPGNPRRGATSFVINNLGYVGTGQSDFGYEEDFYAYDPDNNSWTQVQDFLGEARSSAVGFSHNGKGYVGTGHIFGDHTRDFYEYDPNTNSWVQKADVGPYFRQDATGFVLNGKGYIGTGNDNDATINYEDFWEYDFDTDSWTQINDFCGQGRRYMVSFVIGDVAYAGTGTDGTNLRDFWMFNPVLNTPEQSVSPIKVYPNPSVEWIQFEFESQTGILRLYNLQGQKVLEEFDMQDAFLLRKDELGAGTFVWVFESESNIQSGQILFQ